MEALSQQHFEKQFKIGLGDAILRLVHVELLYSRGVTNVPENLREERALLVKSLNQFQLDIGVDCNNDDVPDTVDMFKQTAETSCCRIVPGTSRKPDKKDSSRSSRK